MLPFTDREQLNAVSMGHQESKEKVPLFIKIAVKLCASSRSSQDVHNVQTQDVETNGVAA